MVLKHGPTYIPSSIVPFWTKTPQIIVSRVSVSTFTLFLGNCSIQPACYSFIIMRAFTCMLHVHCDALQRGQGLSW